MRDSTWDEAHLAWEEISHHLRAFCVEYSLCGSYRREVEVFKDFPIVIIPVLTDLNIVPVNGETIRIFNNIKVISGKNSSYRYHLKDNIIELHFHIASNEDWGAQLLSWTGDAKFNQFLRGKAKRKGMLLNQYGLWLENERIASVTEGEIFNALDERFEEPKYRNYYEPSSRKKY